jgi:hypothetical protein
MPLETRLLVLFREPGDEPRIYEIPEILLSTRVKELVAHGAHLVLIYRRNPCPAKRRWDCVDRIERKVDK